VRRIPALSFLPPVNSLEAKTKPKRRKTAHSIRFASSIATLPRALWFFVWLRLFRTVPQWFFLILVKAFGVSVGGTTMRGSTQDQGLRNAAFNTSCTNSTMPGSSEAFGPATFKILILWLRTNSARAGPGKLGLDLHKCNAGLPNICANWRMSPEPPVSCGAIDKSTVPSESRAFHSVR